MRYLFLFLAFLGVSIGAKSEDPEPGLPTLSPPAADSSPSTVAETDSSDPTASESATPDYIRYQKREDGSSSLQTAVTRFQKGEWEVDLVSVVHLGDASYYKALSDKLAKYDQVLYEMVGGEFQKEAEAAPGQVDGAAPEAAGLRSLQGMASSMLGLKFQLDSIDYEAPNFVHADVSWKQYEELMTAKNQSFSTFFVRALSLSEEGKVPGMPDSEAGMQLMMQRLMGAFLSGNSSELKRMMAPVLADAEGLISELEGEDGTVLVTERNKVVMNKLGELQRDRKGGTYAIFYGGGHMPDLEERLLNGGYEKARSDWMDAWTMPNPETEEVVPDPDANPLGMLMKVLSENPEIGNLLNDLGSAPTVETESEPDANTAPEAE